MPILNIVFVRTANGRCKIPLHFACGHVGQQGQDIWGFVANGAAKGSGARPAWAEQPLMKGLRLLLECSQLIQRKTGIFTNQIKRDAILQHADGNITASLGLTVVLSFGVAFVLSFGVAVLHVIEIIQRERHIGLLLFVVSFDSLDFGVNGTNKIPPHTAGTHVVEQGQDIWGFVADGAVKGSGPRPVWAEQPLMGELRLLLLKLLYFAQSQAGACGNHFRRQAML